MVNNLNMFYGRYDVDGNRDKVDETDARIPVGSPICLRSEHTRMCLKQIRSCKVPGPDCLRGHVLQVGANELTDPLTKLFQCLLYCQIVPNMWKLSFIRPIPKKSGGEKIRRLPPCSHNISSC